MAQTPEDAYCTLLMSDSYLPGAVVLAHSLRDAGATKKLAVLVTEDTLSADTITQLRALYDYVIPVEPIRTPNLQNLYLMGRPDLSYAFTKIALWRQTQFRKVVYLDADVVALRALDELFDIEASFAASPDIGWPDAFNSGVMVLTPDMSVYSELQALAASGESFDGADQGLLNQYYESRPWQRLSFTYNTTPNAEYQWEPAYQHYKKDIKAVHFIGKNKPWSTERSSTSGGSGVYNELVGHWWAVYKKHAHELIGKVSSPDAKWDATRSQPPTQSRPEAAGFPNQTYSFSDNHELYQGPRDYQSKPETLKPIFPWEREPDRAKPTRVFAEDYISEPSQGPAATSSTHGSSTENKPASGATSPGGVSVPQSLDESYEAYQSSNGNAWDNVPGIENYVRSVMDSQTKRGQPQTLQDATGTQDLGSPTLDRIRERRESLILTDFPSSVERPSLPVTPAPQRRPTFWGEDDNEAKELPAAKGVPDQTEWNPQEKLEQLRRSSVVDIEHLKKDEHPNPPLRTLPEHSAVTHGTADPKDTQSDNPEGETGHSKTGFTLQDFGTEFGRSGKTDVSSPTEQRGVTQQDTNEPSAVGGKDLSKQDDTPTKDTPGQDTGAREGTTVPKSAIVEDDTKGDVSAPVVADKIASKEVPVADHGHVDSDVDSKNAPKPDVSNKGVEGETSASRDVAKPSSSEIPKDKAPSTSSQQKQEQDDESTATPKKPEEEDNTLTSLIKAGQNFIGLGVSTGDSSSTPEQSAPQEPSTLQGTISGLLQVGKELTGLGTSEPQDQAAGDSASISASRLSSTNETTTPQPSSTNGTSASGVLSSLYGQSSLTSPISQYSPTLSSSFDRGASSGLGHSSPLLAGSGISSSSTLGSTTGLSGLSSSPYGGASYAAYGTSGVSSSTHGSSGLSSSAYGGNPVSHSYSSSPVLPSSHNFTSSSSQKDISSIPLEGSYTAQILAGQTNIHVPGFEDSTFKVPDAEKRSDL